MRPLRFHVRQAAHPIKGCPTKYQPFTPALTLFLSNNDLTAVPGELYCLTNLEVLSFRGNNITELLPAIGRLHSLKELNVASNQLHSLPFELLSLLQKGLQNITLHPNPFIRPVSSDSHKFTKAASPDQESEQSSSEASRNYSHIASTHVSLLDGTGKMLRGHHPPPSQYPSHRPKSSEMSAQIAQSVKESCNHTPSLLELSLRNLSHAPELSQLPFYIPSTVSPHLSAMLQRTYYLNESGGQTCTICDIDFIIPRTEWVEWWCKEGGPAVPFLRRGCSWACVPDTDKDREVERVGWESGVGMEEVVAATD